MRGRPVDVLSLEEMIEGKSYYITVDRDQILQSTFSQFGFISDFRPTFKVDFMGEESFDSWWPRKEWIRVIKSCNERKIL